jgi:hypothetical protein
MSSDLDIQLRKDALPPNSEILFKVHGKKPCGDAVQTKRFFGLSCPMTIKGRTVPEALIMAVLQEHGLSKTLPTVIDGQGNTKAFYWQPVGGKSHCPSVWPFEWDGIACSITGHGGCIDFRVHDMTPGVGERVVNGILSELYKRAPVPEPRTLLVYQNRAQYAGSDHVWQQFGTRQHRDMETMYMPYEMKEKLIQQMKKFYSMSATYDRYGIVWKRVHLFHGPPGSGKSSMVAALASTFQLNVAQLAISKDLDSAKLALLFQSVPDRTCVLLEDVDALFTERHAETGVSFSALLNALDGIATKRGLVVFITSNHLVKLDPALVRPGRVDCLVEFHLPGMEELRLALKTLGPEYDSEHEAFLAANLGLSIAALQQHLFNCKLEERKSIMAF